MQIMIALFDFPAWGRDQGHEPSLFVDWVRCGPSGPSSTGLVEKDFTVRVIPSNARGTSVASRADVAPINSINGSAYMPR